MWAVATILITLVYTQSACAQGATSVDFSVEPSSSLVVPVAEGFLGLSLEPVTPQAIKSYAGDPVFRNLLTHLVSYQTGKLVIRLGGPTQDEYDQALEPDVWEALYSLYNATRQRVQFTIPLNLRIDNPQLAYSQLKGAVKLLPREAIYAVNLGNEPEAYMTTLNASSGQPYRNDKYMDWSRSPNMYLNEAFLLMANTKEDEELAKWVAQPGNQKIFSGPGVRDLTLFPPSQVEAFGSQVQLDPSQPDAAFVKALTLHQYIHKDSSTVTRPDDILNEDLMAELRDHLAEYAQQAHGLVSNPLQIRVEQLGSVGDGGTPTASNTMAGALFVIDAALGLLQAGVDGVNLHAAGCTPNSPILFPVACKDVPGAQDDARLQAGCPDTCGKDAPAHASGPYFGMWFVQKVLRQSLQLKMFKDEALGDSFNAGVKVYVLRHEVADLVRSLRVVLINKNDVSDTEANNRLVTIAVKGARHWGFGTVTELQSWQKTGTGGLRTTEDMMALGGWGVDETNGKRFKGGTSGEGPPPVCLVRPEFPEQPDAEDTLYKVPLKPATAAVLVIPNISVFKGPEYDTFLSGEGLAALLCQPE